MTDAPHTATPPADDAADLGTVIQRRLVGLIVLLVGVFLVSLLLRNATPSSEALPSVVIPLGSQAGIEPRTNPADEPEVPPAPRGETLASAAAPVEAPAATLPDTAEEKPAAVEAAVAEKPKPKTQAVTPKASAADKPAIAKPAAPKPSITRPDGPARWFVAVGAYKDPMAAQAIANRVKLAGFKAEVSAVTVNKDKLQRVRAGPFASEIAAESARVTLIVEGLTKAVTLSEK